MLKNPTSDTSNKEAASEKPTVQAPSISLPKGGGAIRGIGEKFAANPVTGTGSMTVPIATSPGRSGFGPQLALSYDSGAGNGPFGLGWSLSLPSITRKTDKGLPRYLDGQDQASDSDVFILSGTEDLVPVLRRSASNNLEIHDDPRTVGTIVYRVRRYRPRIEGLFARIERWRNTGDATDVFWRSVSKDNITTWYGRTSNSRMFDPADPTRIFSWLICETYDDKGNLVAYGYKPEDSAGVLQDANGNPLAKAHERNRSDTSRSPQRYLKRIRYGNRAPYFPALKADAWPELQAAPWPKAPNAQPLDGSTDWMFEAVVDYGEHDADAPTPNDAGIWPARQDPFSSYRAGFEVRTYRTCQRVLMFHHFPGVAGVEANCLVRSTDFDYSYEENPADARNPIYTILLSVSQLGYKRHQPSGYLKKSLPPIEFTYTEAQIQEDVRELIGESLDNLPIGLQGSYQWVDLDGEGLSGILTEEGNGWFYKRNLSPTNTVGTNGSVHIEARFAAVELISAKPASSLSAHAQFMDLLGDGRQSLVTFEGPIRGFYERTEDNDWENFRPFTLFPTIDTRDPNLKFVDLDGDGHADILISEDEVFRWYPSLAQDGFGLSQTEPRALDEEKGPALVFADPTQSIFLADLSGDGLADIVRIRCSSVEYWPNLGYGRFGAKVSMDNAPLFDAPDQFDPRRIRLADIDGSGTTDIIYLHSKGVRIYFNQSGNSWSPAHVLTFFPRADSLSSIQAVDLLCNGTACLVWSSPLPGDARHPLRYIDLMGGQKPHLLVKTVNNLGAETTVTYAPSTKFYLSDKLARKPWITKLAFPVHCVEKVVVADKWRGSSFSSSYSYHHGYFDGPEREFRGFGRVEQVDVESFGKFAQGNGSSPYITQDQMLYQPPVKTTTWYHTGALLDRQRTLSQFAHEYFPNWYEDLKPDAVNVLGSFKENSLPEPDLEDQNLSVGEWREALRACKGMKLRQEVCELDVDALERGEHRPVKLFTTAFHNCHIQLLQPKPPSPLRWGIPGITEEPARQPHAVFFVTESEAITYHYELDLTPATVRPDPRIAHTLNLKTDEYGNIQQSVAVVHPRLGRFEDDPKLAEGLTDTLPGIHQAQQETHIAYTETRYTTNDIEGDDEYRLRVPCEVLAYELTGIGPATGQTYFSIEDFRGLRLSPDEYQPVSADPSPSGTPQPDLIEVPEIGYHEIPNGSSKQKRLVEHSRILFFADNLIDPRPFRDLSPLGLLYETYKQALTDVLLNDVFGTKLDAKARAALDNPATSGYLGGTELAARFGGLDTTGQYWIRSGIAGFAPEAPQNFFLPERYTDPFGNMTSIKYDRLNLFVASSTDPLANTTSVTRFDYRTLAPSEIQDINNNSSEVFFDILGLPSATALKGKGSEGDNLLGFDDASANSSLADLAAFFNSPNYDESTVRKWLGDATARHVYYFGQIEQKNPDGTISTLWGQHPSCACGILRETHVSQLNDGAQAAVQAAFEYSDGMGTVLVKKVQAEPEANGKPLRWVANGKTILNNKGRPVKQYEPYFSSSGHRFEEPQEEGVTPVIYYDSVGRTERTEFPDGTFSRVEFSPWHVCIFDQNDTVRDSKWFTDRNPPNPDQPLPVDLITGKPLCTPDQRAAWLAAQHANTPALTILDSLGREVISVAHNRQTDSSGQPANEKYVTFTKLDAEGKPLWIRDARKNLVMQYITPPVPSDQADPTTGFAPCYDIAGNLLFQRSMDAGERWMLNDAAGKPMLAWNSRGYAFRTEYDALHRPIRSWVKGGDPSDKNSEFFASGILFERIIYGEQHPQANQLNLRGKPFRRLDQPGVVTNELNDFKGNPLSGSRRLVQKYDQPVDWSNIESALPTDTTKNFEPASIDAALQPLVETETFSSATIFDALNRPVQILVPHSDKVGTKFNVIRHGYNEANLLERVDVWLGQTAEPTTLLALDTATNQIVENIDYNAKGQRVRIDFGNGASTAYEYDPFTFRLTRLLTDRGAAFASDWPRPSSPRQGGIQNLNYSYDPVGNITDIADYAQQTIFFNGQKVEPSNSYEYDAIYRLITATGREHIGQNASPQVDEDDRPRMNQPLPTDTKAMRNYTERYVYDGVGNILRMIHVAGPSGSWTRRYDYEPASNRLRATSLPGDSDGVFSAKYPYDAHGNMVKMPHLSLMQWNFKDELQATSKTVNNTATPGMTWYDYDGSGQRVRKVADGQNGMRNQRIYLGGFEIYREYNGNEVKLECQTLHVMDNKHRLALVETRNQGSNVSPMRLTRYQFGNHLGSVCLELDDDAQIISYEEYTPYGSTSYQAVRSQTETAKRYRFTGKERDEENGLCYHGARYYAPWLGRWVNSDPAGLEDGLNLFQYTHCSPINLRDPSGHQAVAPEQLKARQDFFSLPESERSRKASTGTPEDRRVFARSLGFSSSVSPVLNEALDKASATERHFERETLPGLTKLGVGAGVASGVGLAAYGIASTEGAGALLQVGAGTLRSAAQSAASPFTIIGLLAAWEGAANAPGQRTQLVDRPTLGKQANVTAQFFAIDLALRFVSGLAQTPKPTQPAATLIDRSRELGHAGEAQISGTQNRNIVARVEGRGIKPDRAVLPIGPGGRIGESSVGTLELQEIKNAVKIGSRDVHAILRYLEFLKGARSAGIDVRPLILHTLSHTPLPGGLQEAATLGDLVHRAGSIRR